MPSSLHILAARVVKRVTDAGGAVDPVEHFGELAELDRLARAIDAPPVATELDLLDAPICVEDVELRRLSWAAREWLATDAFTWWKDDPGQLDLAYAWAMVHARDKAALQYVRQGERAALQMILAWARSTTANYDAIMAACRYLTPKTTGEKPKTAADPQDRSHIGPVLLTLLTETTQPLDYWIFEAPSELVEATLARIREDAIADSQRMVRMLGKDVPPSPHSWHIKATARFNAAARAFVERLTGGGKTGIGPTETAVGPAKVDDQCGRVDSGKHMQHEAGGVPAEKPSGDCAQKKEDRRPGPQIHELRPAGDKQRGKPVVG